MEALVERSGRARFLVFAANFLRHPRMVASVVPSSRFLIKRLLHQVDWDGARTFVEYGPGVGNITGAILKRMHADAKLIVIETNPDFVEFLRRAYPDPRLEIVNRSAADVGDILKERSLGGADIIVSGIPFSQFTDQTRKTILDATNAALGPAGKFLVYQFTLTLTQYLSRHFGRVERDWEMLNVPPSVLFFCSPRL